MKIIAYLLTLILTAFYYFAFASVMSVAAGLNSYLPIINVLLSISIFGIFSWLHFYLPKVGSIILSIAVCYLYFYEIVLGFFSSINSNFISGDLIILLIPTFLSASIVYLLWKKPKKEEEEEFHLGLAIIPLMIGMFFGWPIISVFF